MAGSRGTISACTVEVDGGLTELPAAELQEVVDGSPDGQELARALVARLARVADGDRRPLGDPVTVDHDDGHEDLLYPVLVDEAYALVIALFPARRGPGRVWIVKVGRVASGRVPVPAQKEATERLQAWQRRGRR